MDVGSAMSSVTLLKHAHGHGHAVVMVSVSTSTYSRCTSIHSMVTSTHVVAQGHLKQGRAFQQGVAGKPEFSPVFTEKPRFSQFSAVFLRKQGFPHSAGFPATALKTSMVFTMRHFRKCPRG